MNDWTLPGLLDKFRSEAECRAWIEVARWPNGVRCRRCSSDLVRRLSTRSSQFNCRDCRYRFSVTSRTPLHETHLPLRTWLLATYLMATSTHGIVDREGCATHEATRASLEEETAVSPWAASPDRCDSRRHSVADPSIRCPSLWGSDRTPMVPESHFPLECAPRHPFPVASGRCHWYPVYLRQGR